MTSEHDNILTKTRAEEHEEDIWGEFYIPPYFNKLLLKSATKSSYIVGKRGCGKTMLLKYLDYHTAFSSKRNKIPEKEVSHIGIYWRADTQFCNSLNHRGLTEHDWISIFNEYFSLIIAIEIIKSIKTIATSAFEKFSNDDFNNLKFNSIPDFHSDFPSDAKELQSYLESKRRRFSTWSSHIAKVEKPIMPPGKHFLDSMIEDIKKAVGLENSSFYIYVDEFENLAQYQKRVLNTFLKHCQKPILINFISKELADETATTGSESINATHDFRLQPLDGLMSAEETKVFFSEVFLANLDLSENKADSELVTCLRSFNHIGSRSTAEYKSTLINRIKSLFPSKTLKEFAADSFNNPSINSILQTRISNALKGGETKLTVDDFLSFDSVPEAIIILPALLNRPKNPPEALLSHLETYSKTSTGPYKDWLHNNLFGGLLELYRPYNNLCPVYSGFDTFFTMSNSNLRHFLILCYKSLEIADLLDERSDSISIETQSRAAVESSDQLIKEIQTFGTQGNRLRMFVLRLGGIFRGLQSSPPMSEPEQTQFTINAGKRALSDEESAFLSEAKKHGIITEVLETKTKSFTGADIVDYHLNPIYSPYFQISYRKKRKIPMSVEDFQVLSLGSEDDYNALVKKLLKNEPKNEDVPSDSQPDLW